MYYCKNCGKTYQENEVLTVNKVKLCPVCETIVNSEDLEKKAKNSIGILNLILLIIISVLTIFITPLGLIFGLIAGVAALLKGNKKAGAAYIVTPALIFLVMMFIIMKFGM